MKGGFGVCISEADGSCGKIKLRAMGSDSAMRLSTMLELSSTRVVKIQPATESAPCNEHVRPTAGGSQQSMHVDPIM